MVILDITLNTDELKRTVNEIKRLKSFFDINKDNYLKYKYSDIYTLSGALSKIYTTFENISDNLDTLNSVLIDYYTDIELLERTFNDSNQILLKNIDTEFNVIKS